MFKTTNENTEEMLRRAARKRAQAIEKAKLKECTPKELKATIRQSGKTPGELAQATRVPSFVIGRFIGCHNISRPCMQRLALYFGMVVAKQADRRGEHFRKLVRPSQPTPTTTLLDDTDKLVRKVLAPRYVPTEEEIAEQAAAIRKGWSSATLASR